MALTLRVPKGAVKKIARKFASDYRDAAFGAKYAEHVPCVYNGLADLLSHRYDPTRSDDWHLPPRLQDVPRELVPVGHSSLRRLK